MKFRQFKLKSGTKILLGKNAETNDELMKLYKGKQNTILHTSKPGSPFCVIENLNPTKDEIQEASIICAAKSQDWRDNKTDIKLHKFAGKDIKKTIFMKTGTWKIKSKPEIIKTKKLDIKKWEKKNGI
jgi:predicted ribosome quality control (RQC) complex YloA/Tae2 family protein